MLIAANPMLSAQILPSDCSRKFDALSPIASGEFGSVWKARQRDLDRIVAIRILHSKILTQPGQVDRFFGEAKVLSRLDHPGILGVYDFGAESGTPWLATEHLDGQDIRSRSMSS